jgi:hypothetical protein
MALVTTAEKYDEDHGLAARWFNIREKTLST